MTALWILSGIVGLSACVAFAFHHKYAGLWISYVAIILGLAAVFAWFHAWIAESEKNQSLTFSAASEGGFTAPTRDIATTRFCLALWHANEYIIVPVTDLILVRFTNSEETPAVIDYYAIEVRVGNGKWQKVLCLNGLNGKIFWRGSVNEGREITFDSPRFDVAVKDVNIPANGGTAKGWILLERPEGFDKRQNRQWRLRARDAKGRSGYSIISDPPKRDVDDSSQFSSGLGSFGFTWGEREDLSSFRMTYYSDFLKH